MPSIDDISTPKIPTSGIPLSFEFPADAIQRKHDSIPLRENKNPVALKKKKKINK